MLDGCSNFEFHMSIKTSNGRIDANTMILQFLLSKGMCRLCSLMSSLY